MDKQRIARLGSKFALGAVSSALIGVLIKLEYNIGDRIDDYFSNDEEASEDD